MSGRTPALVTMPLGVHAKSANAELDVPDSPFLQLSFVSPGDGWILSNGKLLSTSDGGAGWTEITPPPQSNRSMVSAPATTKPVSDNAGPDSAPPSSRAPFLHTSVHLGFHQCEAGKIAQMGSWWSSSPFYDVGVYIGGDNRSCKNVQVIPNWVTQVENQGWGLMPLWVGPQAPCACAPPTGNGCNPFGHVISTDPKVASTQGAQEADNAMNTACPLGLCNTVVYYDMEQYNPTTQCSAAVQDFVDGWVSEMHIDGFVAGVYGSPYNYTDFNVSSPPDDIWMAKTLNSGTPSVTIWGLSPLCDPYSSNPCNLWSNNQRIHQFLANHAENWGGVAFTIDPDIEDATVAGFAGTKTYTFNFSSFDYAGSVATNAQGINDINSSGTGFINRSGQVGQIIGYYTLSDYSFFGFQDNAGAFTSINFPGAAYTGTFGISEFDWNVGWYANTDGSGAAYLDKAGSFVSLRPSGSARPGNVFGVNDAGLVVGSYIDSSNNEHSFLYNANTQQFSTDYYSLIPYSINGTGQVVGVFGTGSLLYSNGSYTPIAFPSALGTTATGINNNGQIVGYYIDSSNVFHSFLYDLNNGVYTSFDYPGAPASTTTAAGINDQRQIVGREAQHGFLSSPQ
jgi:probable HAF family extracellular repeat protein